MFSGFWNEIVGPRRGCHGCIGWPNRIAGTQLNVYLHADYYYLVNWLVDHFCFLFSQSQAATSGKYLDSCLNMLVSNFLPPPWVIKKHSDTRVINKKRKVLSRVHAALLKISVLVPLAPSRLLPILAHKMPKIHKKDQVSLSFW